MIVVEIVICKNERLIVIFTNLPGISGQLENVQ